MDKSIYNCIVYWLSQSTLRRHLREWWHEATTTQCPNSSMTMTRLTCNSNGHLTLPRTGRLYGHGFNLQHLKDYALFISISIFFLTPFSVIISWAAFYVFWAIYVERISFMMSILSPRPFVSLFSFRFFSGWGGFWLEISFEPCRLMIIINWLFHSRNPTIVITCTSTVVYSVNRWHTTNWNGNVKVHWSSFSFSLYIYIKKIFSTKIKAVYLCFSYHTNAMLPKFPNEYSYIAKRDIGNRTSNYPPSSPKIIKGRRKRGRRKRGRRERGREWGYHTSQKVVNNRTLAIFLLGLLFRTMDIILRRRIEDIKVPFTCVTDFEHAG